MNILLGLSILSCGLHMTACVPTGSQVMRSSVAQVQATPSRRVTDPASPAVMQPQHRWTCTASGAGMAGTCKHN